MAAGRHRPHSPRRLAGRPGGVAADWFGPRRLNPKPSRRAGAVLGEIGANRGGRGPQSEARGGPARTSPNRDGPVRSRLAAGLRCPRRLRRGGPARPSAARCGPARPSAARGGPAGPRRPRRGGPARPSAAILEYCRPGRWPPLATAASGINCGLGPLRLRARALVQASS